VSKLLSLTLFKEKEKKLVLGGAPIDLMAFADDGALKNHLGPSMSIIGQLIPPQHIIYKNVGCCFSFPAMIYIWAKRTFLVH